MESNITIIDQHFQVVERYLKMYDELPELEKIPPIMSHDIEVIRWGLEEPVGFLADDDTRQYLGEEKWATVERGMEVLEDLKDKIRRTWDASDRG